MQPEMEFIIDTRNLQFGFSKKKILLKKINLKVERGSIYGFLGPNGAGKTTTIRLILGLLKDSSESIYIFDKSLSDNRIATLSKIGALIEQPSLYEHLSGYDNLEITRRLKKINRERVTEVLQIVKLTDAANKKVKAYSLGMKQRLGIALALLGQPELLVLDEPVNGLDPSGMMEMREMIKSINQQYGTTIFLSSHLISEVEKIVTHVGIINMGELLFQGTANELRSLGNVRLHLHIDVDDPSKAASLLANKYSVTRQQDILDVVIASKQEVNEIITNLVSNHIKIYEATVDNNNLERIFLNMTEHYTVS
jgi:lantibiotic transport system ATP-binding protein